MKLKCPLVGTAFAAVAVVGGAADAASSVVNFVDSSFSFSSTPPVDSLDDLTSMTRTQTWLWRGATIGNDSFGAPVRIDDKLLGRGGQPAVENAGMLVPASSTWTIWSYEVHPLGSGYHSRYDLDGGRSDPRHPATISGFVVSEPATWGMMLLGVGLMAAGLLTMRVKRDRPATNEKLYSL